MEDVEADEFSVWNERGFEEGDMAESKHIERSQLRFG